MRSDPIPASAPVLTKNTDCVGSQAKFLQETMHGGHGGQAVQIRAKRFSDLLNISPPIKSLPRGP